MLFDFAFHDFSASYISSRPQKALREFAPPHLAHRSDSPPPPLSRLPSRVPHLPRQGPDGAAV